MSGRERERESKRHIFIHLQNLWNSDPTIPEISPDNNLGPRHPIQESTKLIQIHKQNLKLKSQSYRNATLFINMVACHSKIEKNGENCGWKKPKMGNINWDYYNLYSLLYCLRINEHNISCNFYVWIWGSQCICTFRVATAYGLMVSLYSYRVFTFPAFIQQLQSFFDPWVDWIPVLLKSNSTGDDIEAFKLRSGLQHIL